MEELSAADYEWVQQHFREGPQEEEWWELKRLEYSFDLWEDFNGAEKEEMETKDNDFFFYTFAKDTRKGPEYRVAVFREETGQWGKGIPDNVGRKTLVQLEGFSGMPIITLGRLALTLDTLMNRYIGYMAGTIYVNDVPDDFARDRNYRKLYFFEDSFIQDWLSGWVDELPLFPL